MGISGHCECPKSAIWGTDNWVKPANEEDEQDDDDGVEAEEEAEEMEVGRWRRLSTGRSALSCGCS